MITILANVVVAAAAVGKPFWDTESRWLSLAALASLNPAAATASH
jgi:hypothetical protein